MARALRAIVANECYHVINRGNQKARVFHCDSDYAAFIGFMLEAQDRIELPLLAVCLMPNHIHLVVRPCRDCDLAKWMSWLFTTHVRRHHRKYGTTGRLWQGRYKASLIQRDQHLLTVLRYVERNALSANLVNRAEDWRWSSLNWRALPTPPLALTPAPIALPSYWMDFVNQALTSAELEAIRESVRRQRPFGSPEWVEASARATGSEQSIAPIGRPRRKREGTDPFCWEKGAAPISERQALRTEPGQRRLIPAPQGDDLEDLAHFPGQHEPARLAGEPRPVLRIVLRQREFGS
jgi:putative transposase